ncbi:MAG: Fic family protein [Desulfobacteraceae bacterium]|nr:Fic family protein [Desulfobacteraceae bacterium]
MDKTLEQVDDLKKCLDSFRPLEGLNIEKLNRYFDEVYTYDSTGIEGNTLTLQETSLVLNKGVTIGGKSLREHFEVVNHIEAIEYIKGLVKDQEELNQRVLLEIHYLILKSINSENAGKYRWEDVRISGSKHTPPSFLKVQELMDEYFEYYKENKEKLNPILLSAYMHEKLVTIHPFVDGNGRTSRLIMNLILLQNGFPITNISSERNKREKYYSTLEKVQTQNDDTAFLKFVAGNVKKALIEYLEVVAMNKEPGSKGEYFYKRYLELKGE